MTLFRSTCRQLSLLPLLFLSIILVSCGSDGGGRPSEDLSLLESLRCKSLDDGKVECLIKDLLEGKKIDDSCAILVEEKGVEDKVGRSIAAGDAVIKDGKVTFTSPSVGTYAFKYGCGEKTILVHKDFVVGAKTPVLTSDPKDPGKGPGPGGDGGGDGGDGKGKGGSNPNPSCYDTKDCPGFRTCDSAKHVCILPAGRCEKKEDCKEGQSCETMGLAASTCRFEPDRCEKKEDCRSNEKCEATKCVPIPPECGNKKVETGEECDLGKPSSDPKVCTNECTKFVPEGKLDKFTAERLDSKKLGLVKLHWEFEEGVKSAYIYGQSFNRKPGDKDCGVTKDGRYLLVTKGGENIGSDSDIFKGVEDLLKSAEQCKEDGTNCLEHKKSESSAIDCRIDLIKEGKGLLKEEILKEIKDKDGKILYAPQTIFTRTLTQKNKFVLVYQNAAGDWKAALPKNEGGTEMSVDSPKVEITSFDATMENSNPPELKVKVNYADAEGIMLLNSEGKEIDVCKSGKPPVGSGPKDNTWTCGLEDLFKAKLVKVGEDGKKEIEVRVRAQGIGVINWDSRWAVVALKDPELRLEAGDLKCDTGKGGDPDHCGGKLTLHWFVKRGYTIQQTTTSNVPTPDYRYPDDRYDEFIKVKSGSIPGGVKGAWLSQHKIDLELVDITKPGKKGDVDVIDPGAVVGSELTGQVIVPRDHKHFNLWRLYAEDFDGKFYSGPWIDRTLKPYVDLKDVTTTEFKGVRRCKHCSKWDLYDAVRWSDTVSAYIKGTLRWRHVGRLEIACKGKGKAGDSSGGFLWSWESVEDGKEYDVRIGPVDWTVKGEVVRCLFTAYGFGSGGGRGPKLFSRSGESMRGEWTDTEYPLGRGPEDYWTGDWYLKGLLDELRKELPE